MTSEPIRVTFRLSREPRLIPVIRGGAQLAAAQAGFDNAQCEDFARASEDVCRESLLQLADSDGNFEVVFATFPDRIEISILHPGHSMPALGLETFVVPESSSGRPAGLTGVELLTCVDRVLFNTEGGTASTTLVKFRRPAQ